MRILALEDNPGDLLLLQSEVATWEEPVELVVTCTLKDAMEAAYEIQFDCAIVDMTVSDANKESVVKHMISTAPFLPLVVLSGIDPEELEGMLGLGVQEIVSKSELHILQKAVSRSRLRKKADSVIRFRATHDPLTGLYNRAHIMEVLDDSLEYMHRYGGEVTLLYLDLDNFKPINDTYGHEVGDTVLVKIVERLKSCLRSNDILARLGGDEFIILLGNIIPSETSKVVTKVINNISTPLRVDGVPKDLEVGVSIGGVSIGPEQKISPQEALSLADQAMYKAKELGGNTWVWSKTQRPSLYQDVLGILSRDEISVVYQPIVQKGGMIGLESFIRWNRGGDVVRPDEFIPMLERSGRILQVGEWVINQVLTQQSTNPNPIPIAINVSPRQLNKGFAAFVEKRLKHYKVSPNLISLEITESLILNDEVSFQELSAIQEIGIKIYIDDLGSGFGSNSIFKFPFDGIKLDKSLVQSTNDKIHTICKALVYGCELLKIDIIAEGVETIDQSTRMLQLGIQKQQGYLFSRPFHLGHKSTIPFPRFKEPNEA